jgi:NADH:ubiquinone oxidoreductase subunit 4 (subunit M)
VTWRSGSGSLGIAESSSSSACVDPAFGIDYYLGVDGISLLLVMLAGFLTPIALLSSWESVRKVKEFSIFIWRSKPP